MTDRMAMNGKEPAQPISVEQGDAARAVMAGKWAGAREHSLLPPAGQVAPHGGAERAEFFSGLYAPMQNGTGDPAKAKRKAA